MDAERLTYTIDEARKASGLGTTKLYELMGSGQIEARKAGSRTLIPAESLRRYLDSLPPAVIRTATRQAAA